jgi:hypothetical protein
MTDPAAPERTIAMESDDAVERIRARMAELRSELSCDVQDVGRSARAMTDVGLYVRRFPWATAALALAVGYLLVPRKKQVVHPGPADLAKLVEQKKIRVETGAVESSSKNMIGGLVAMGLMTAAKAAMNLLAQRVTSAAAARYARPADDEADAQYETVTT